MPRPLAPAFEPPASTAVPPPANVQPAADTTTRPVAPAGSATTTAPRAGPSAGGGATIPLAPPLPGMYRYDTTGQSQFGPATAPFPAVTTLVVDPPTGTVQHATRDLRDASRSGVVLETVFDYRPDGIWLVSLKATATFLLFSQSQELRPPAPVLLLPTGFAAGLHRDLDVPAGGATAHLALDVQPPEQVTVAGQPVATTPVHLVVTIPGPPAASLDLTVWVAPAYRLWAREHAVAQAAGPDGQAFYRSQYDATLERLTPS